MSRWRGTRANITFTPAARGRRSPILDDGYDGSTDPKLGGELMLLDPRMPQIRMYAPHLRLREADGGEQLVEPFVRPRTGMLVVFPAWLAHAVRPLRGGGMRISVALNLSAE